MALDALVLLFLMQVPVQEPLEAVGKHAEDRCPMTVEVNSSGAFFTNRFHGRYMTSPKLLERDLKGGCYHDSNPAPVSSVRIKVEPGAPERRVALLCRILATNGWPKSRIQIGVWEAGGH